MSCCPAQHVVALPEEKRQYAWQQDSPERALPASLPACLLASLVHAVDAAALAGCLGVEGPEQGSPQQQPQQQQGRAQQQEQGGAQQQSWQGPSAEPPSKQQRGGEADHVAAAAASEAPAAPGTAAAAAPTPAMGDVGSTGSGSGARVSTQLLVGVVGWSLDWIKRAVANTCQNNPTKLSIEDLGLQTG